MSYYENKGLAMCGLACVLCSSEECPGCKAKGCADKGHYNKSACAIYACAAKKELEGCYQCSEYPCKEGIFQNVRVRAFNQYAAQFGERALLERLRENYSNGIFYHDPEGGKGDYDCLDSEDEIMELLQFGRCNPYEKCPVYETGHFKLRLVTKEDAEDLQICYRVSMVSKLINRDGCPPEEFDFADRMEQVIEGWLNQDYANRYFIRFAVIDKPTGKVIGTIETYDRKYQKKNRNIGVLRMDILSGFEKEVYLRELLEISSHIFFKIYHSEIVLHKVEPEAIERIAASGKSGFTPIEIEGREHYWMRKGEV